MTDASEPQTEDEIVPTEISDEALEATGLLGNSGVYTQMGLCTFSTCGI
jgi:hypothetical protein